jgi:DNA ligase-1
MHHHLLSQRPGQQPPNRRRLLGALALVCWPWGAGQAAGAAPRPQASFPPAPPAPFPWPPQLAREAPEGVDPQGFLVSEKLDGVRALWDGQTLRFRSGRPIAAPAWFTAALPAHALDGELWSGRGRFDAVSGMVRRRQPVDADWRALRYAVFDLPAAAGPFAERAAWLQQWAASAAPPHCLAVQQWALPSRQALQRRLQAVVQAGGEGLMLHRASALWLPGRSGQVLKLKPLHDAEATVVGHQAGRGRHAGRLGALRVRSDAGVVFEIGTGFSDAERTRPPAPGTRISYTHRGYTPAGVPRFASFLRVRED